MATGYTFDDDAPVKSKGYTFDDDPAIAPAIAAQASAPNMLQRLGSDYDTRVNNAQEIANKEAMGTKSSLPARLEMGAQLIAGPLADLGTEASSSLIGGLNSITPQSIKDSTEAKRQAIANSPVGQAVGNAAQYIGKKASAFGADHPEIADALKAGGTIISGASSLLSGKAAANAALGVTEATGSALYNSGKAAFDKKRGQFLQELITPKETPTVRADLFSRSKEQGLFRNRVVEPSDQEQSIIDTLHGLPVKKSQSLLANYNVIADENAKEAQSLIAKLKQNDVEIPDDHIINALSDVGNDLEKSPYITGDGAQKSVRNVINGALEAIQNNPQTASGLLQARKDFDAFINEYKKNAFDPAISSPVTDAVQRVRQAINGIVDNAVPDAQVKLSLRKQSNLYRAMDSIETKGGYEGKNIFTRGAQKITDSIPGKGILAKTAVTVGSAAGLGLATGPTAALGATYLAGKAATSPTTRKIIGTALKAAGKAGGALTREEILALPPAAAIQYLNTLKGKK